MFKSTAEFDQAVRRFLMALRDEAWNGDVSKLKEIVGVDDVEFHQVAGRVQAMRFVDLVFGSSNEELRIPPSITVTYAGLDFIERVNS